MTDLTKMIRRDARLPAATGEIVNVALRFEQDVVCNLVNTGPDAFPRASVVGLSVGSASQFGSPDRKYEAVCGRPIITIGQTRRSEVFSPSPVNRFVAMATWNRFLNRKVRANVRSHSRPKRRGRGRLDPRHDRRPARLVGVSPNADLTAAAFSITLGGSAARYTFDDVGAKGTRLGFLVASVRTDGTATVLFNNPIFDGTVATFFIDLGRRATIDASQLGDFNASPDFALIDAETPSYIGLAFDLEDGTHYGFAPVTGRTLFDFAFDDEAGAGATVQPGPYAAIPAPAPVPLPATAPLLAFAAAGLAALRRRLKAA